MSDDNPLSRKISTLIAEDDFDGAALRLGPAGGPEALQHILQAMDDTMLLRDAVFAVGESQVTLQISGKRLLRVVAASDDLAPPEGLIDAQLSAETTGEIRQAAELLERLVAQEGDLTLVRRPTESKVKQAGSGIGIQTLSSSFSAQEKPQSLDGIDTFLAALTDCALSVGELDGEKLTEISGDQSQVADLKGYCDNFWADFAAKHGNVISTTGRYFLVMVEVPDAVELTFVSAKADEKQYVALVNTSKVSTLADAWL